ncbi:hypothetical protein F4805DRAFT_463894 [Annulohypoxylon moriforme]|nr:hypothetical protein F4805DRAFT_463894 [Annulohypoxylon moriforme]
MPQNSSSTSKKTKSSKRSYSGEDNVSTKTRRGSPAPQLPNTSNRGDNSARTYDDPYNLDQDLLGFGAQFDDKK